MIDAHHQLDAGRRRSRDDAVEIFPVDAVLAARLDAPPRYRQLCPGEPCRLEELKIAVRGGRVSEQEDARAVVRIRRDDLHRRRWCRRGRRIGWRDLSA